MFTVGMVITDTLDGRMMVRLLRQVSDRAEALAYRRKVGWVVVALSYGVALYGIAKYLFPIIEPGDTMLTVTGFVLFLGLLMAYLWLVSCPQTPSHSPTQE